MLTTLPNLLTLSRILAVPILVGTFYLPQPWAPWVACVLFSAAGITDWLDGHFARRWKQQTDFGRFLDPIADKLVVAAALFMLVATGRVGGLTILPALVILMREILVSGLREHLAGLHVGVPVSRLAKWRTGLQMVAIGVLLVGDAGPDFIPVRMIGEGMLWIAAALTLLTGYDYLHAGLTHMDGSPVAPPPRRAAEPRTIA
jgi:CDP-diacylglycerol---glycerol-3-phosphate 3-phosphatidyltransferase